MKKINIYLFIVLLFFIQDALAADNWSEDYCMKYKTLQQWYRLANEADHKRDSVTALKYYFGLQLVGFGKGSMEKPWPEIRKFIDERIKFNKNKIMELQTERVKQRYQIEMSKEK